MVRHGGQMLLQDNRLRLPLGKPDSILGVLAVKGLCLIGNYFSKSTVGSGHENSALMLLRRAG